MSTGYVIQNMDGLYYDLFRSRFTEKKNRSIWPTRALAQANLDKHKLADCAVQEITFEEKE